MRIDEVKCNATVQRLTGESNDFIGIVMSSEEFAVLALILLRGVAWGTSHTGQYANLLFNKMDRLRIDLPSWALETEIEPYLKVSVPCSVCSCQRCVDLKKVNLTRR